MLNSKRMRCVKCLFRWHGAEPVTAHFLKAFPQKLLLAFRHSLSKIVSGNVVSDLYSEGAFLESQPEFLLS
jgi:hypothetical protein